MFPHVDCKHNSRNVLCDYTNKRCILYPLVSKKYGRGIGKPIYKDTYCQLQEPWPEGQTRNDWKKKRSRK